MVRQNYFLSTGAQEYRTQQATSLNITHHAKMRQKFINTDKEKSPVYSEVLQGCHNTGSYTQYSTMRIEDENT